MYIPFHNLPAHARIWVFQSVQPFSAEQQSHIVAELQVFLNQWTAHSQTLVASAYIFHQHFLVVGLNQDQAQASGCAIDKLMHAIQTIDSQLNTNLLDRLHFAYQSPSGVAMATQAEFKQKIILGEITPETLVFNTLIAQKHELDQFQIPLKNSWQKRFLPKILA